MRIVSTKKAQKSGAAHHAANGNQESELQISKRPQFRASKVMAHALALYNLETAHTVSQTMNTALRQFLPARYIAQAEQHLRNGKEQTA
jgi:hypothetical protein